jgi:hypothetical protein
MIKFTIMNKFLNIIINFLYSIKKASKIDRIKKFLLSIN